MSEVGGGDGDAVAFDRLLDGRLLLHQFRKGHRAGTDAVLLAAAADIEPNDRYVDVGAGAGAVGLALGLRAPESSGVLLEKDAAVAALARRNVAANSLDRQVRVACVDLFDPAACRNEGLVSSASLVVTNPPFYLPGTIRPSAVPAKSTAHVLSADLHSAWVRRACALLRPKGRFIMIHRPDALPDLLAALADLLGDIVLRPIHARPDAPAIRVLLAGRRDSKAPLTLREPLVLHQADGAFTPDVADLHAGGTMRLWPKENRPRRAG